MPSCSYSLFRPGDGSSNMNSSHLQSPPQTQSQMLEESPILPAFSHFPARDQQQQLSGSASILSPLPLSASPANPNVHPRPEQQQLNATQNSQAESPQLPRAPIRNTIPLPEMDGGEYSGGADVRQLQHLNRHQKMQGREHQPFMHGTPINLSGLHQHSLGSTSSHPRPLLSVDTSFDPNSLCSPSHSGFPTSNSDSALGDMGQKTPNVYINGLPPHFPEDQLFALASPFGEIRSVRTFTRHVRDNESGYGFVLSVHSLLSISVFYLIVRIYSGLRRSRLPRGVLYPCGVTEICTRPSQRSISFRWRLK